MPIGRDKKKVPELASAQYQLMNCILKNITRIPNGRRYDELSLDLWYALFCISPSAYCFASSFLPIPDDLTLSRSFSEENDTLKNYGGNKTNLMKKSTSLKL